MELGGTVAVEPGNNYLVTKSTWRQWIWIDFVFSLTEL